MVSRGTKVRCFWLLLAFTGLFGMLTCKATTELKFDHVPQRFYARATATSASLSQRNRLEKQVAVAVTELALAVAAGSLLQLFVFRRNRAVSRRPVRVARALPLLWPPPLLFRPPPVSSVA